MGTEIKELVSLADAGLKKKKVIQMFKIMVSYYRPDFNLSCSSGHTAPIFPYGGIGLSQAAAMPVDGE